MQRPYLHIFSAAVDPKFLSSLMMRSVIVSVDGSTNF